MHHKEHYSTVVEAIEALKKKGYTIDFNLDENCLVCGTDKYKIEDLEIVDVYHYEGDTDPADKASLYAIESKSGEKGILLVGNNANVEPHQEETLRRLSIRK